VQPVSVEGMYQIHPSVVLDNSPWFRDVPLFTTEGFPISNLVLNAPTGEIIGKFTNAAGKQQLLIITVDTQPGALGRVHGGGVNRG
jgi:hypothetical protein